MVRIGTIIRHEHLEAVQRGLALFGIDILSTQHLPDEWLDFIVVEAGNYASIRFFLDWYDAYIKILKEGAHG